MKKIFLLCALTISLFAQAQKLPVQWEELTEPDFVEAQKKAEGVCIIPMGVIEKHATHLPLGTDVFYARHLSKLAAEQEYCVLYPFYIAGQILEAKHQPGTIAYSPELLYKILEETCDEIARNGFKKIIFVNGHGGNTTFLQYFCQSRLYEKHDYTCYLFQPALDGETQKKIQQLRRSKAGGHADEVETSNLLIVRPDLVKMEDMNKESGEDQGRLQLPNVYTGIWWYAKYPNHYAGDAQGAKVEIGKAVQDFTAKQLAQVIKNIKADQATKELENTFYQESKNPFSTPSRK